MLVNNATNFIRCTPSVSPYGFHATHSSVWYLTCNQFLIT